MPMFVTFLLIVLQVIIGAMWLLAITCREGAYALAAQDAPAFESALWLFERGKISSHRFALACEVHRWSLDYIQKWHG